MTLSREQIRRCYKASYIVLMIVTLLFVIRNIQSCFTGNLVSSVVALSILFLGIITATLLILFTKDKGTTIYGLCAIGFIMYAAELFTHKEVEDYCFIIPIIIISLLTFNAKFIGIIGAVAIGINIINIMYKTVLLKEFDIKTYLNIIVFIILIAGTTQLWQI